MYGHVEVDGLEFDAGVKIRQHDLCCRALKPMGRIKQLKVVAATFSADAYLAAFEKSVPIE
jgi:hypothetical protein